MVGPASSRPRPPGALSAPNSPIACCTRTPSSRETPLPYHSSGQVGAAQPDVPRRSHHSPTVMSGSQFSSSHWVTSAVTSRVGRSAMSVITSPCEISSFATVQTEVEGAVKFSLFVRRRDHTGSLGAVHGAKRTWPAALPRWRRLRRETPALVVRRSRRTGGHPGLRPDTPVRGRRLRRRRRLGFADAWAAGVEDRRGGHVGRAGGG